ncbi:MAG: hypothetical protein ACI4JM_08765 [Oscillospiraceae bacterium]
MDTSTVCIIGGAVIIAGIVGYYCYKKYGSEPTNLTDMFTEVTDEQLVVDKVCGKDLAAWFKVKNADKKYSNVILYPNEKNIEQFKLPKNIVDNSGNLIVQVIYNEKTGKPVVCRSVLFEEIDSSLANMLEKNNGMIIVE